jgi:ABC-2 type transport system ATP-binding protein
VWFAYCCSVRTPASNHPNAVEVEQLVVEYGQITAVNSVSFTARTGKITVILGSNGAGKTSTLEVCEGFRSPTAGSVRVLGLDPLRERGELNRHMGVMLQDGGVYPSSRVGEVIEHYCALYGNQMKANDLIERVGLAHRRSSTWRRLSGGEKQRLSLALALAAKPTIAFLDEPTAGVDVEGREMIREVVRDLSMEGCTVIMATHELDEADRCADDVIVFHQASIVASGTLQSLRQGHDEIRFTTARGIDPSALSAHIGATVLQDGSDYVVAGTSDAKIIGLISDWLAEQHQGIDNLRAGSQRLEEIFRRLTQRGNS